MISVYNRPEWSRYKSGIHCITHLDDHCHTEMGFTRNNLSFLKKRSRLISHRKQWASSRWEKREEKKRERKRGQSAPWRLLFDVVLSGLQIHKPGLFVTLLFCIFILKPQVWEKNQHKRHVNGRFIEQWHWTVCSIYSPHPTPTRWIAFHLSWLNEH